MSTDFSRKIAASITRKFGDSRFYPNEGDFALLTTAKLESILSTYVENYDTETQQKLVTAIQNFANESEINKYKLLSYCMNFCDSTEKTERAGVRLQAFLKEDELTKLYKFVKRHETDCTFGETVFQVMDRHEIKKPADVYKNAMMSRQDFSRVTAPQCKSVSRQLAWQIIIGLHCSLQEADEVLFSAGFIRRKTRFDLVIEHFITIQNYDIMAINDVLEELGMKAFSCYRPVKDNNTQ